MMQEDDTTVRPTRNISQEWYMDAVIPTKTLTDQTVSDFTAPKAGPCLCYKFSSKSTDILEPLH